MTRIALIAGTYKPDRCGVAHYTDRLRNALTERGIETIVLTTHKAAADPTIRGVVKDWNIRNLMPLIRAIHQTQADVLHIQHAAGTYGFDRAIFLLPLLLRLTGWHSPIVTTIHEYGWWEWQPRWISQSLVEWLKTWGQQQGWWDREDGFLITQSNAVITTNVDAERVISERLPHHQTHRISIGANVEVAKVTHSIARQKLLQTCQWTEDSKIIAFFGFLHPVKGLETLLPAFKKVLNTQPEARLVLIGGVESLALRGSDAQNYWQKLEDTIAQLDLKNHVHMTGYLDADTASHYLTASDIGVLPFNHGVTLKSGSLLTLMAHRLPVVASCINSGDLPCVREIAPRNVNQLSDELTNLLCDPELRHQLSLSGYRFSKQFNWSSITDSHLKIYQSVLSESPAIASNAII
jgi:glycosyltransferase involved in cell wall biosynthesis